MKSIYFPAPVADEMIRAILDGHKSITRLVCKIKVNGSESVFHEKCSRVEYPAGNRYGICANFYDAKGLYAGAATAPYQPGDILYVREAWAKMCCFDCAYDDCEINIDRMGLTIPCDGGVYIYKATDLVNTNPKWCPSVHMPKEAARIFLRVTNVRAERLQDITEEQAEKEGCRAGSIVITGGPWGVEDDPEIWTAKEEFTELWDSPIKKADLPLYGWAANPWVFVIEFERISKEEALKGVH